MTETTMLNVETMRSARRGHGAATAILAVLSRIGRGIVALAEAFAEARQRQRLYEDLSRMSDRELADIGLRRGDIAAVVAGVHRPERRIAS